MFKKFKDKLAEEMKPARLQASMQQLAQAVSPALSNSSIHSIQDVVVSNDNFSLTEEGDETPKNSPAKHGFQNVDLMTPPSNSIGMSRRSSVSSITSDTSALFPIYESPKNLYHLQSDMDQSASEVDENISPQLDRITKDQLYSAYRKVQAKYQKYRSRYTDLAAHYRELEHVKSKLETLLVETQDKALRRIADLKEQCQLEQQAKAHLEEVLRNDIEEKDHIISTLNTKVKLLQANGTALENPPETEKPPDKEDQKGDLIDLSNQTPATAPDDAVLTENAQLKDKLKKLENVILKYKDSLKRNKDKFTEVVQEKNTVEHDYEAFKTSNSEQMKSLTDELVIAREKISNLSEQINVLKKREEESAISLAENKLSIHRELEGKEELIKTLQHDLKQTIESRDHFSETVERHKAEIEKLKLVCSNQQLDVNKSQKSTKAEFNEEKAEKYAKADANREETDIATRNISSNIEEIEALNFSLKKKEEELQLLTVKLADLQKTSEDYQSANEKLHSELSNSNIKYKDLKSEYDAQRIIMDEKLREAEATINMLQNATDGLNEELDAVRNNLSQKEEACENLNMKVQEYAVVLEKVKQQLLAQDSELKQFKERAQDENQTCKLQAELESKNVEILGLNSEVKSHKSTISDLREKIQSNNSDIDLLQQQKRSLQSTISQYKNSVQKFREDYVSLKDFAKKGLLDQNKGLSYISKAINEFISKSAMSNKMLQRQKDELNVKLNEVNQTLSELETELQDTKNSKLLLEKELTSCHKEIKDLKQDLEEHNKLGADNTKLTGEIESLNCKILDMEKLQTDVEKAREEANNLKEQIKLLKDVEKINEQQLEEINNLKKNTQDNEYFTTQLEEIKKKYEEALNTAKLLQVENDSYKAIEQEMENLKSEMNTLNAILLEKDQNMSLLEKRLAENQEQLTRVRSECDSYLEKIKTLEPFEASYRQLNEEHLKAMEELRTSNKTLQENLDTRNVQLKKLKALKERHQKTIQDMTNELQELQKKTSEMSTTIKNLEDQKKALEIETSEMAALKDSAATMRSELEQLRIMGHQVSLENKDLKDRENELLMCNEELLNSENALKERIDEYVKENQRLSDNIIELEKDLESYKLKVSNNNEEMHSIIDETLSKSKKVEENNAELKEQVNNLNVQLKQLHENNEVITQQNQNLVENISDLTKDLNSVKEELNQATEVHKKVTAAFEEEKNTLQEQLKILTNDNLTLKNKIDSLESKKMEETGELVSRMEHIQKDNDSLAERLAEMKSVIDDKDAELNSLKAKCAELHTNIEKITAESAKMTKENAIEIEALKNSILDFQQKIAEQQVVIKSLQESRDALQKELDNVNNTAIAEKSDKLVEENKKLEAQLDEALITFQAKETQMQIVNSELKSQASRLKDELKTNEEEQGMRLKQLVKEFQAQLQDKEEELQAALEKRFDRQQNYESDIIQQYKTQLKDFQIELTSKSEQIENLILEMKESEAQKQKEIDQLSDIITDIKREHSEELKEIEKKWKNIIMQRTDNLQSKYEDEVNELTREWQKERKNDSAEDIVEELENTSRVAMAAVQSNTGSFHALQQTLASQRRELNELRKLLKLRHDTLEDTTEIEYLRNILFEYMMGRETMVLARVIAAVVKFDQEQTTKILKKEEDKLTLLGSLGLT